MKNKSLATFFTFLLLQFVFSSNIVLFAEQVVSAVGSVSVRLPGNPEFQPMKKGVELYVGTLFKGNVDFENQAVASSAIEVGSHTISIYPGALLKYSLGKFVPLVGRFSISGKKQTEKIIFQTDKFVMEMGQGEVLLEVTKLGGIYVAVKRNTDIFIKEFNRVVHEPTAGTELFFPMFGEVKTSSRISSRWRETPEGYAKVDELPESSLEKSEKKNKKLEKPVDIDNGSGTAELKEDSEDENLDLDIEEADPEVLEDSLIEPEELEELKNASDSLNSGR